MDCGEKMNDCGNRWVRLNVGGTIFQTTRTTLACYPDSFLHKLVQEDSDLKTDRDESGAYLIDRNPKYFAPVLDFVRHGELVMDQNLAEGVLMEADFFGLPKLVELVKLRMEKNSPYPKNWVKLNVGGTIFYAARSTLAKYPKSFLNKLVTEDSDLKTDGSGVYFIDRNPKYFTTMLEYMRHGELVMDQNLDEEGVLREADFFGLPMLVELVKLRMEKNSPHSKNWVKLNVGGTIFHTARSTLAKHPTPFFKKLVKEDSDLKTDGSGAYFIDRNPKYFTTVLEFMRHGELVMDKNLDEEGVLREADFFGVQGLAKLMQTKVRELQMEEEEKSRRMSQKKSTYISTYDEKDREELGSSIQSYIERKLKQGWTLDKVVILAPHNGAIVTMLP